MLGRIPKSGGTQTKKEEEVEKEEEEEWEIFPLSGVSRAPPDNWEPFQVILLVQSWEQIPKAVKE